MLKIQWYPGHMNKTKKNLITQFKNIDIIIEVIDSRIPKSSRNPLIENLIKNKNHLIILNKIDLSSKEATEKWILNFKKLKIKAIAIKATNQNSCKKIFCYFKEIKKNILIQRQKKGLSNRPLRCIVVGVANVGKSSLINSLAKRKIAKIGKKPGITKGNQWIKIDDKIELLDTPGILWPKFEEKIGFNLAITGAISDLVVDQIELSLNLIDLIIIKKNKTNYKNYNSILYLENYCKKIGALIKGNKFDMKKGALHFIKCFRNGKFGKMTLELPEK